MKRRRVTGRVRIMNVLGCDEIKIDVHPPLEGAKLTACESQDPETNPNNFEERSE
jgi:hypothetical protein